MSTTAEQQHIVCGFYGKIYQKTHSKKEIMFWINGLSDIVVCTDKDQVQDGGQISTIHVILLLPLFIVTVRNNLKGKRMKIIIKIGHHQKVISDQYFIIHYTIL
jgi:hypothetical protein